MFESLASCFAFRCSDYARNDKLSFFTVKIIGLPTLDDDSIGS